MLEDKQNEKPWMMRKYSPRMLITTFASFLSLGGMVGSLVFIIGSLVMILMVKIYCDDCDGSPSSGLRYGAGHHVMYGIGFSVLFCSIGLMYFCIQLWKKIRNKNLFGMIQLVLIGNFVLAIFEVLTCLALTTVFFFFYNHKHLGFHVLVAVVSWIYTLLSGLKIFGTIKLKPGFVKPSILFNILAYIFSVILMIIFPDTFVRPDPRDDHNIKELCLIIAVMVFLLISCVYIYLNSFIVLLYNILLEEQSRMESIEIEMMEGSTLDNAPTAPRMESRKKETEEMDEDTLYPTLPSVLYTPVTRSPAPTNKMIENEYIYDTC